MDNNVIPMEVLTEEGSGKNNHIMTMSTPPHLLSNALGVGPGGGDSPENEDFRSKRQYQNHRSKSHLTSSFWQRGLYCYLHN